MKWISVKDRLPELEEVVWAWTGEFPYIACRTDVGEEEGWLWAVSSGTVYMDDGKITADCETDDDYQMTHWMPLPEPPKIEDDDVVVKPVYQSTQTFKTVNNRKLK